ncbi:MAG: isocitrate/isopropylmalate family dehydrogenase [Granulosicoccaceae bacterium]|jgi:tartrate dehydrogenase/decarboxylase/D-malate dehydrogenase
MGRKKTWKIAVLPGDGIGEEVIAATLPVLVAVAEQSGLELEYETFAWPSSAWHCKTGQMMPDDALEQLRRYDAMLLGALGDPGPLSDSNRYVLPDGISLAPLLTLRKDFDLWACERPARYYPGARQYLADPRSLEMDMLVIRENSEGEYVNQGGRLHRGTAYEIATQVEVFTRVATERLIRHAFESATRRLEKRRQGVLPAKTFHDDRGGGAGAQVCLVTKRNALPYWGELYTEVFNEIGRDYPDIGMHHELVDAACMKFVQSPWLFDVVVASNLQGDILTDLAAVLSGGMGVAPSCNIKPDDRSVPPLFEPTHGSAPDIAGQGKADPRAMILTAAMMLEWMGIEDDAAQAACLKVRRAVEKDLSKKLEGRSTEAIRNAVMAAL